MSVEFHQINTRRKSRSKPNEMSKLITAAELVPYIRSKGPDGAVGLEGHAQCSKPELGRHASPEVHHTGRRRFLFAPAMNDAARSTKDTRRFRRARPWGAVMQSGTDRWPEIDTCMRCIMRLPACVSPSSSQSCSTNRVLSL